MKITTENKKAQDFCRAFDEIDPSNRYLFGVNEYSEMLAGEIDIGGFVDDFFSPKKYLGKPVLTIEEVPKDALVVSTLLGRPLLGKALLDAANLQNLDFFGFYNHWKTKLPLVRFWGSGLDDLRQNFQEYEWVRGLLSDGESREVFDKIISLRSSGDLEQLYGFSDRQAEQYFEDFLPISDHGEVFVDVGSFDGYTSREFIKRCPNYDSVLVFEPEPANLSKLNKELSGFRNIRIVNKGLSNRTGTAKISGTGSTSCIGESGENQIELDILDNYISEGATFLKFDIEGMEMQALEGAENVIRQCAPKIAIAVYHETTDIWEIPKRILSFYPYEKVFLRHYTEGVVETVMFFVPKNAAD